MVSAGLNPRPRSGRVRHALVAAAAHYVSAAFVPELFAGGFFAFVAAMAFAVQA
jgi:hypothetical protein